MKQQYSHVRMTVLFNLLVITGLLSHFHNTTTTPSPDLAMAYLDPGTGTMVISAIVGVFATIVLGIKTFWYKLVHIFKPGAKKSVKGTTGKK